MKKIIGTQIYLVTESDGFFGQRHMPWEGMNLDEIERHLGPEFKPTRVTWMQLANGEVCPRGGVIIHSSSQQPEYKSFIDDVLLYLESVGNQLIPSIHATRSHENKGYQELHKRLLGIPSLRSTYFAKIKELDVEKIKFPAVIKALSGYGSGGVNLVSNVTELVAAAKPKRSVPWMNLLSHWKRGLGYLIRKHIFRRNNLRPYGDYYSDLSRCVVQEFVPNLDCDYKVLAFRKRMFVARRLVHSNDFRASGSGSIVWEDPPSGLLLLKRCFANLMNLTCLLIVLLMVENFI